jgi:hypothetical protein
MSESLKHWQETHQTSNPRLAKKHGIKLSPAAIKKVLEKHGEKEKDVYGLAKHRKMFDSPEHKKAVAHGKAKQAYEDSHSI